MSRSLVYVVAYVLFVLALAGGTASDTWAQDPARQLQVASRGPRFIAGWAGGGGKVIDASSAAVLRQRVSLELSGVTVDQALKALIRQAKLEISYSPALLPSRKTVSLRAADITVAAALTEILLDAGVDVALGRGRTLALVKRPAAVVPPAQPDSGMILGRVTDQATGSPLAGASVTVEQIQRTVTADADGRFRIVDVPVGSYTVGARYIGYVAASAPVTVGAGEQVTVDFGLEKSVQKLDEVVTTGTYLPTEVKALPTPITIVTAADIEQQHPQTINDVLRQAVPGAVGFELAGSPVTTSFSLRGTSTLAGGGQVKIFVDGVEASAFGTNPVDPNSIERIEVIRGPQAATLYGSDAAAGVVQIFTKRGETGAARPSVQVQAEAGIAETPYRGFDGVLRQNYAASIRGGVEDASYNFGVSYLRLGDWLPNGELSSQSNPSVYGGIRFARGIFTADLSGRYLVTNSSRALNPLLLQAGFVPFSRPSYTAQQSTNQTVGARLSLAPMSWWHSSLTVGLDRFGLDVEQTRRRETTPADTLFTVVSVTSSKIFVGLNSSIERSLGSSVTASFTAGLDYYRLPSSSFSTARAVNTIGTIQVSPAGAFTQSRTVITNTGYFAQAQLNISDAVFVTAGLRAEENSTFGDELGTPLLPRVGLSAVHGLGSMTVKVRGSYGRAIRAPRPGQTFAAATPTAITLANPLLGPEQQRGWEAGFDLVFGDRGSLSVTGYDQVADDLILFVRTASEPLPTSQFQNVGRVSNTGVEVEGGLNLGSLQLKGQYGYVRSRIEDLGPNFQGDERVGDRPVAMPAHTAGISMSVAPWAGGSLSSGLTYVGSFRNYDIIAQFKCFGGTGACQPANRDYIMDYPGFAKLNLSVKQELTRHVAGLLTIDNLTNNQAYEAANSSAVIGRVTTLGVHLRY